MAPVESLRGRAAPGARRTEGRLTDERRHCDRAVVRRRRHRVRHRLGALDPRPAGGERAHARDRGRGAGRRRRLPQPPVHDHRHRGGGALRHPAGGPGCADGRRLRHRRHLLGGGRLYRHEHLGARQRAHGRGRPQRPGRGAARGLPGRRHHGAAGGRPGPAGRGGLLRGPRRHDPLGRDGQPRPPRRPRLRRLADLGLRPSRRRHLHQGRGRRRRPRGQGGGGHPRGRPAQPGGHRRQRGRQRGRLRRHGRRPLRDLRGDDHRHHAARGAQLQGGRGARRSSIRWCWAAPPSSPR